MSISTLLSLLVTPTFMNGSLQKGTKSVWAALDNLHVLAAQSAGATPADSDTIVDDTDGIMLYGPLVPDADSTAELARSQVVAVDQNGTVVAVISDSAVPPPAPPAELQKPGQDAAPATEGWSWRWPFYRADGAAASAPQTVKKRVWVPSTAQLSLQVMWWGYRLCAFPPACARGPALTTRFAGGSRPPCSWNWATTRPTRSRSARRS